MAKQLFANNATSTLSGILPQGGTTLVCTSGHGARFPTPTSGEYFLLTLYTKDAYAVEQQVEVVKVTNRSGDVMTIERDVELLTGEVGGFAYNGSTTTVFLELRWTAMGATNILQASDNLAGLNSVSTSRTNLGLGNVDNTSDLNKPISTSTQAALDDKAATNHTHSQYVDTSDARLSDARPASDVSAWAKEATKPTYTKADVGLGSVDNTADTDKPVSGATQAALNTKQAVLVSGTNIKTINGTSLLDAGDITAGDVTTTGIQTLTNKTLTGYTETVYALTGTVITPANGTVQTKTLTGNTTFTESLGDGQSVVLMLNPGTYTVTWPTTSWVSSAGGGAAPTLKASAMNTVVLWQVAGVLYGNWIGSL